MAKMVQDDWDSIVSFPKRTGQDVQKYVLEQPNDNPISLSALGLLFNLCTYPPRWEVHKTELYKRFGQDGEKSVKSAWLDLVEKHYVVEYKYRSGKKWEYVYHYRRVPYSSEEVDQILDTATKEYGEVWGLRFGDSKLETPKGRVNQVPLLNKFSNKTIINKDIAKFDDDKRTPPPGEDSAIHSEEDMDLIISMLRIATEGDLSNRSYNSVVRKVMDKYNQGKIGEGKFRDYLVTSLVNKVDDLELRRMKESAKSALHKTKRSKDQIRKEMESKPIKTVPFYDWLNN